MVKDGIWQVLTAPEAARLWELNESTVRRALLEGRMTGRKADGAWLIDEKEMRRVYGDPPLESEAELEQRHPGRPQAMQETDDDNE